MAQSARTENVVHSPNNPATAAPARLARGARSATRTSFVAAALGLAGVAGVAGVAEAQPRAGAVIGVVKDSAGTPIQGVEVVAIRSATAARTDTAGRFVLAALPPGAADLSLRRILYEPVVVTIDVPQADTVEIEIRLGGLPRSLPAVVVTDRADHARVLAEFESRRKLGVGHFITRAEIEKRHPLRLSDMVRSIPGASVVPVENGRPALRFARSHNSCPPQYFLDGLRVSGFNLDDVPPGDVEGVELYAGPAGLPPEFNQLYGTTVCGTVAIWTRIPGNTPAKP